MAAAKSDQASAGENRVSGQQAFRLIPEVGPTGEPFQVEFSPDGRRILTAHEDGSVKLWDAHTGKEYLTLSSGLIPALAVFSSDGTSVISSGYGEHWSRTVIWDAFAGDVVATLLGVGIASLTSDRGMIAIGSSNGVILIWRSPEGRLLKVVKTGVKDLREAKISRDGKLIAAIGEEGIVRIFDASTGQGVSAIRDKGAKIDKFEFSPSGEEVATRNKRSIARLWSAYSGQPLAVPHAGRKKPNDIYYSRDGQVLITEYWGDCCRYWEANTGTALTELNEASARPCEATISSNGVTVLHRFFDKYLELAMSPAGDHWHSISVPCEGFGRPNSGSYLIDYSADGASMVGCNYDTKTKSGGLCIWDSTTLERKVDTRSAFQPACSVRFAPASNILVVGLQDGTLVFVDLTSGAVSQSSGFNTRELHSFPMTKRGDVIATWSTDTSISIIDTASGRSLNRLKGHKKGIAGASFSPDESRIITCSRDKSAKVWNVVSGAECFTLPDHKAIITCGRFSPNGALIATITSDRTLRIWDAEDGLLISSICVRDDQIVTVEFSGSSHRLHVLTGDGGIAWEADTPDGLVPIPTSVSGNGQTSLQSSGPQIDCAFDAQIPEFMEAPSPSADETGPMKRSPLGTYLLREFDGGSGSHSILMADSRDIWPPSACVCSDARSVMFSHDEQLLVAVQLSGEIRIWDSASSRELASLFFFARSRGARTSWLAMSPDGRFDSSEGAYPSHGHFVSISERTVELVKPTVTELEQLHVPRFLSQELRRRLNI